MNEFNPTLVTERPQHFQEMGWTDFTETYAALQELSFHREFQVDTETTGLGSFLTEKAFSLQIGIPGKQFVFDLETVPLNTRGTFDRLFRDAAVIGHNLAFDLPYLFQAGVIPRRYFDTLLAEQLLLLGLQPNPTRAKTLAALCDRYLGIELDKTQQSTIAGGLMSAADIEYAARDVWPLEMLKDAMTPKIKRFGLTHRVALENRFLPVLVYLEYSGVAVDHDKIKNWILRIESEAYQADLVMKQYADINWNSSAQVVEVLREHGIEEYDTDTGNPTTSDDVLQHRTEPIAADLRKHRAAHKLVSTYGRKWLHYVLPDGRIHTRYRQLVETGRTASGSVDRKKFDPFDITYRCERPFPNMQNLPRSKEFRACFVAGGHNQVLVVSDYSSQESVILADQSEDPAMLQFFLGGTGDMHSYVTRLIWPELADLSDDEIKEHHSEKRTLAKTASFSIAYGGNADTIVANIGCDRETALFVYTRYMEAFSSLPLFFKRCFDFSWQNLYIPTDDLTHGKRFFDNAREFKEIQGDTERWARYYELKKAGGEAYEVEKERAKPHFRRAADLKRMSVNTKIQGTAAVMSKLAGIYFFEWILSQGLFGRVKIPIFVHDEWVAECDVKIADQVSDKLKECMERAGQLCLHHLTIHADPKICTHWEK